MRDGQHNKRLNYLNHIRVVEYAEGQSVSLLEIRGIGRSTIKALWSLGIQTAQQLFEAEPEKLGLCLRRKGLPLGNDQQAKQTIAAWQSEILTLMVDRTGPKALAWEEV
jgi:hypothetical protein